MPAAMLFVDLKRFGQLCATVPEPNLRAFGTGPYVRLVPIPRLSTRAIAARLGSLYLCFVSDPRPRLIPVVIYMELRTIPGYALRAGWMRGIGRVLRYELFPDSDAPP